MVQKRLGFKPYYKWIIFNTLYFSKSNFSLSESFKPYYKWIIFNTPCIEAKRYKWEARVLNLIINGLSSILTVVGTTVSSLWTFVLNLIINGLSSILYYLRVYSIYINYVLNLIINGLSSILYYDNSQFGKFMGFKPYYKWIIFNTR